MEIFGIGITELLLIVVLILIIFGPEDLVKNSAEIGRFLNKVVTSDVWRGIQKTTSEVKKIPVTLMREANLQAFEEERRKLGQDLRQAVADPNLLSDQPKHTPQPPSASGPENPVAPAAQPANANTPQSSNPDHA